MPLCFFCLKGLSLLLSPPGAFSYLLHKLGSIWLCDGTWNQTKCYIYWKARLSPKYEEVGAELCSFWVQLYAWTNIPMWFFHSDFFSLGKVPSMFIRVELNLSHWLLVCRWYGLVHIFCIPISLTEVSHQLTLKISSLICQDLLGQPIVDNKFCPIGF